MQQTLDAQQAALILHLHVDTVRRLARVGTLPGSRIGKGWLFQQADLLAYLDSCRPGTRHERGQS